MTEESDIASRLLRASAAATEPTNEERSFSSLLSETRRCFRRNSTQQVTRRGRKRKTTFKKKVVLLKLAHADFFPSSAELKFLKSKGLGESTEQLTIFRGSSLNQIKENIASLYGGNIQHLLQMCGFTLARLDKTKRIIPITETEITNGYDLEHCLSQSRLVVLPLNDFPNDFLTTCATQEEDASTLSPLLASPKWSDDDDFEATAPSHQTPRTYSQQNTRHDNHCRQCPSPEELSWDYNEIRVSHRRPSRLSMRNSTITHTLDHSPLAPSGLPCAVSEVTPSYERQEILTNRRSNSSRLLAPRSLPPSSLTSENNSEDDDNDEEGGSGDDTNQPQDPSSCFLVFPSLPENAEVQEIIVSRSNCVNDVMRAYSNEGSVNNKLDVTFTGEMGIDGGGLTKELFSIFFMECENLFFKGEDCLVPYLDLHQMSAIDKFVVIGRVIQHMLILTGKLPSKLSRVPLMLIADPDREIDEKIIVEDLLSYVNPYLRTILKKGLKNYQMLKDRENELILDFFQSNRFFERPNVETFRAQLTVIGREVLIEKPRRIISKLREGVAPNKYPLFWNKCNFDTLFEMQIPTARKVVNCLVTNSNLTNEESEVLHYFVTYINCLSKDDVAHLVFMITGSLLMPDAINVNFNDAVGLSQRPTFSTCTDTITLPKTYANYSDLKNDLNICLKSEEAKKYTAY